MSIEARQWSDKELQAHLGQWNKVRQSGKKLDVTLHEHPGMFPKLDKMYFLTSDGSMVSLTLSQAFHVKEWLDSQESIPPLHYLSNHTNQAMRICKDILEEYQEHGSDPEWQKHLLPRLCNLGEYIIEIIKGLNEEQEEYRHGRAD